MPAPFLPEAFVEKFTRLLGSEAEEFFAYSRRKLGKSFRVNPLKAVMPAVQASLERQGFGLEPLSFSPEAFRVPGENIELGKTPEYALGSIAVQEASSMVPALVLAPQPGQLVLDACAAPGSKTSQMAALMENQGGILALDVNRERVKSLKFTLGRLGVANTVVALNDATKTAFPALFDRVLLDAPCSSEGLVRKRLDALKGWSPRLVEYKARLQKKLILKAFDALKEGGQLVYSTCTLSPEENEEVVQFLLAERPAAGLLSVRLPGFRFRPGLLEGLEACARVLPQDNDSEAFFVARLGKGKA
ncbi:MAG TPA: RsmB/NOP family class I SAM-dependent RNA methyltransferase [Candidatus Diapherotrites archaeon]|uniref:RsmB/NOP family class I SAM-dependent RNA methyltransferase n=1 Tax=Candidatus Iainarchaeum sp. TaxID=3101447 RepID=A0A7J4JHC0_9ARCH|nr:RsmB/NOP family class I SAM-dependent RNA methyltransferase [Candidatus Diapherotrites archaeon]HIH17152.1 RsmB/NOP family class I SAM-dependent RNA methyltransferase [Candidatus Diapherotrites archaeon]